MIRKVEKIVADTPEVASFSRRTGVRAGPLRHPAQQGRRPGAPQAARPAPALGGRDHRGHARRRSQEAVPGPRGRVRPAPAGHDRRPGGPAQPDRGEDLRRRRRSAWPRSRRRSSRRSRRSQGVVDVVGVERGDPGGDLADRPRGRGPARPHRRAGLAAAPGGLAGRGRDRAAPARPHRSPCACAIRTPSASIPTRLAPDARCAARTARWRPSRSLAHADRAAGRADPAAREPAPDGDWSPRAWRAATWAARSRRSRPRLAGGQAARRLHDRGRRASTSRSARPSASCCWCSPSPPRWCCWCW